MLSLGPPGLPGSAAVLRQHPHHRVPAASGWGTPDDCSEMLAAICATLWGTGFPEGRP